MSYGYTHFMNGETKAYGDASFYFFSVILGEERCFYLPQVTWPLTEPRRS